MPESFETTAAPGFDPADTVGQKAASPADRRRLVRWQVLTVALMLVGYAGIYLCRSNFSVTLKLIAASLVEQGYEPDAAVVGLGWVASWGTWAYALGKFAAGNLADRLGGRRNVLMGMAGSVLFTLLFALCGAVPLFTLAWAGNRVVQSLCWSGMVKITGRWFSYSTYGTAMGVVSLSFLFGDAAARWFMGLLLEAGLGWREVFAIAAGCLSALLVLNLLWLEESPRAIGYREPEANPANVYAASGADESNDSLSSFLVPLLTSPQFLVVCMLSLGLTLLRETFGQWSPTYFVEVIGSSPAQAAYQSGFFPLLGGASVLVAGWVGDRLGHLGRSGVIFLGCLMTSVVLLALAEIPFATGSWLPVALVGLVGFLMLGPYSYLAGALSLDLGGKRGGATACGIIDGVGYLGAYLSGGSVAQLSVDFGWSGAFRALAGVALLTTGAGALFFVLQRKGRV